MDLIAFGNTTGQAEKRRTTVPVRSVTSVRVLSILEFLALLPPSGVAASERGVGWLWVLFAAVIATLLWQRIFAEVRRRPFIPDSIIAAIACSIVLPASAPLWQVALALSFGIVVGQEIFGGRGRNFLNPAMVALAFFMFSFPGRPLEVLTPAIGLSVIPGALLLLAGGLISWRIVVGAAVGLLLISLIITADLPAGRRIADLFFVWPCLFCRRSGRCSFDEPGAMDLRNSLRRSGGFSRRCRYANDGNRRVRSIDCRHPGSAH